MATYKDLLIRMNKVRNSEGFRKIYRKVLKHKSNVKYISFVNFGDVTLYFRNFYRHANLFKCTGIF